MNKTAVFSFGVEGSYNGLPTATTPAFDEACKQASRIISEGKYGLVEADFWAAGRPEHQGTVWVYQTLVIKHDGVKKVNAALPKELQFNPFFLLNPKDRNTETGTGEINWQLLTPVAKEGPTRVLTYISYPTPQMPNVPMVYVTAEVNIGNIGNFTYPSASLQKRIFDRTVLELSGLGSYGIHGDSESKEFSQPVPSQETMMKPVAPVSSPAPAPVEVKEEKSKKTRKTKVEAAKTDENSAKEELPAEAKEQPVVKPKVEKSAETEQVPTAAQPVGHIHSEIVKVTMEDAMEYVAIEGPLKGKKMSESIMNVGAGDTAGQTMTMRMLMGYRTSGNPKDRAVASLLFTALRDPQSPVKFGKNA